MANFQGKFFVRQHENLKIKEKLIVYQISLATLIHSASLF